MKWSKSIKSTVRTLAAMVTLAAIVVGLKPVNANSATAVVSKEDVDVIVIQSEAFIDVARITEMKLSKDPLPNYRVWRDKSKHGLLKVPVNGGLTCNAEFELLTGIRQSSISYLTFVDTIVKKNEKVNSLAWLLKDNGYSTIGVHPHLRTYFNRDVAYPLLGIDKFVSVENFSKPQRFGSWVKDEDSFNMVLKQLNKDDKKKFIFNVTVQNHAPFCKKPTTINVDSKAFVNAEDKESMQNFVSGLWYTDQELDKFMKAIEKRERRTIVVFYGDHQPTKNHKSFANMAFFKENGYFMTEYFIYDNKGKYDKSEQNLSLVQMRYEIESALGIDQSTALKAFVVTEGYSAYDKMKVRDMQAFYKGENSRLR